jgi:hypothetical protein
VINQEESKSDLHQVLEKYGKSSNNITDIAPGQHAENYFDQNVSFNKSKKLSLNEDINESAYSKKRDSIDSSPKSSVKMSKTYEPLFSPQSKGTFDKKRGSLPPILT